LPGFHHGVFQLFEPSAFPLDPNGETWASDTSSSSSEEDRLLSTLGPFSTKKSNSIKKEGSSPEDSTIVAHSSSDDDDDILEVECMGIKLPPSSQKSAGTLPLPTNIYMNQEACSLDESPRKEDKKKKPAATIMTSTTKKLGKREQQWEKHFQDAYRVYKGPRAAGRKDSSSCADNHLHKFA
jgi:hypothetical protein